MRLIKNISLACALAVLFMISPHAYAADGDLVWRTNISSSFGGAPFGGVTVDSTGIYLAGYYFTGIYFGDWYLEKRTLDGGALIWQKRQFLNNGVPVDIAVDLTGAYSTGPVDYGASRRTEKRSLSNGNIVWERTDGHINPSWVFSASENYGYHGITVNGSGVYVVVDDSLGLTSMWDPTWAQMVNVYNLQWLIEKRALDTGDLLWAKTSNPSIGKDVVHKVTVDSSGIYVVGQQFVSLGFYYTDTLWRIEKRALDTGDLLWVKTIDPSIYTDVPFGVVTDDSGVYIAGTSNANWRIEKRSLNTGDILWQKEIPPPNIYWGVARDIAVNSSGVYIVGSDTLANAGNMNWRMEKRSLNTGDLIWQKIIPDGDSSTAFGVATDVSSVYTVGWSTVPGSQWFPLEKRESIPNSSCGSANGISTATVPVPTPAVPPNNLCTGGTAPVVTDTGASFAWTCDGLDNLDATADDVSCSAPKPLVLSLCTVGGISIASASATSYDRALFFPGSPESLHAYYDATSNICTDSAPITDAIWSEDGASSVVSIAGANAAPQIVTPGSTGIERVTVTKGTDTIFLDYGVTAACVKDCTDAPNICQGRTFDDANGCGTNNCEGTRYCDFNWKEVAPGR